MTFAVKEIRLPWLLKSIQGLEFPHKLGVCDRLFGRALATHGVCWVPTAASIPWKLDLVNSTHRWIVYGKYEGPGFLQWARTFLPPSGVVIDSGANIGQMALYLAQWVPQGIVLAFEPGEEQADWLDECLQLNSFLSVEVVRLALGANTSELYLTKAGLSTNHGTQNYVSASGGTPVHVIRLSDEMKRRGISKVDLWKLDVEGYEFEALLGAESLLRDRAIRALYIEIQDLHQAEILAYLRSFGYRSYSISWRGIPLPADRFADFDMGLFLPN